MIVSPPYFHCRGGSSVVPRQRILVSPMHLRALTLAILSTLCWTGSPAQQPRTTADLMKRAPEAEVKKHSDRDWLKKSMLDLNGHWVDASFAPNGFIQENLDRQWKPYGTQREATMNGQGRQLYAMMVA